MTFHVCASQRHSCSRPRAQRRRYVRRLKDPHSLFDRADTRSFAEAGENLPPSKERVQLTFPALARARARVIGETSIDPIIADLR